jgi:cytochrome oxidase assembly protein ShyY1
MLGRYEQNWSLLLDNKIFHGRTGVHVLNLFRTRTGKSVLVDRGWLEMNPDRRELPVVPVMNKEVVISGLLSHPVTDGVRLGATQQIELKNGPVLITYLDMDTVTAAAGEAIEPMLLKLDAQDATGFEDREWQPAIILPAQHKAYAVQWFALALASIILIFTMAIKIRRNTP